MLISILFVFIINRVCGVSVTITPERAHISENTNLTVMCRSEKPLVGCQFRHGSRPVIDLSAGHRSIATDDYRYYGNGLQQGECGVVLNTKHLANDTFHFVDCRVKTIQGGWLYNSMDVFVTNLNSLNIVTMPPREVVVVPGNRVNVFVRAEGTLTKCKFRIPSLGWVDFTKNVLATSKNYKYLGRGLWAGECGVTLLKATTAIDGMGFVSIDTNKNDLEIIFFRFIVAKTPGVPVLSMSPGEGEFSASCSVTGKPWANISWFIGDELVRRDEENEALDDADWKPYKRLQTLQWRLREGDLGKNLRCVATHLTLPKPVQAIVVITAPPPSLKLRIEPQRAHISETENLTVMCRAEEPVFGCHFQRGILPVIDLSAGHGANSTVDYQYYGNGLQQGECGIVLNTRLFANSSFHSVSCRVKTVRGGWVYRSMDVYVTDFLPINILVMPPREVVVRPGDVVSLLVKVDAPLTKCKVLFNSLGRLDFSESTVSNDTSLYRYHGDGLRSGDCGVTILNATRDLAGSGFFSIRTEVATQEIFFVSIIIAQPPSVSMVSVSPGEGEISASCSVTGQPWANISWFIGDELVRRDEENEELSNAGWKPPRRLQTLLWKLREGDVGMKLRCVATHLALPEPVEATAIITSIKSTSQPELTTTEGSREPARAATTLSFVKGDTTTARSAVKTEQEQLLAPDDGDKMNLSLIIGLVAGLFVSCVVGFVIYVWYTARWCFAHPSTREVRHGQIGMSKLLESDEPTESVTISSYVGLDA